MYELIIVSKSSLPTQNYYIASLLEQISASLYLLTAVTAQFLNSKVLFLNIIPKLAKFDLV